MENQTAIQNGKAPALSSELANTSKANQSSKIISVEAEEVKQRPTIQQVFEGIEKGKSLQDFHEKSSTRFKEVATFNRKAKEFGNFVLKGFLPSGEIIEFSHAPSNLEFVENQERKGKEHMESLESEIKNFSII